MNILRALRDRNTKPVPSWDETQATHASKTELERDIEALLRDLRARLAAGRTKWEQSKAEFNQVCNRAKVSLQGDRREIQDKLLWDVSMLKDEMQWLNLVERDIRGLIRELDSIAAYDYLARVEVKVTALALGSEAADRDTKEVGEAAVEVLQRVRLVTQKMRERLESERAASSIQTQPTTNDPRIEQIRGELMRELELEGGQSVT